MGFSGTIVNVELCYFASALVLNLVSYLSRDLVAPMSVRSNPATNVGMTMVAGRRVSATAKWPSVPCRT